MAAQDVWVSQLATEGPMGRSVRDVARLLRTQAGWSPNTPLSIASGADETSAGGTFDFKSQRIGWLGNLNGYLAMEPGILDACASGLQRLQALGCAVEPARLGMAPERVWDAWLVWRRVLVASRIAPFFHRWMEVVIYATFAGLPCISVPVGFNDAGLPMGMQLIGQPQDDAGVLRLAAAYEQLIGDWLAVRPSSAT